MRDVVHGSPKARVAAAHALGDVREPTEKRRAIEVLRAALLDDRPEVRAEACSSLADLGDPSVIPEIVKRLDDGSAGVRQNAAIALGTFAHPDGFAPLALALLEGPADLRFQAATSLAEIDQKRAYEPLVAALGDRDPQVVAAAALSLGAIAEPRAIPLLVARLDHSDPATRFDVGYALAELGDPAGRAVLVAAVGDLERAWDAVTALGRLADTAALAAALANKRVPPEATVLAAGKLLELAPDGPQREAARRVLLAGLTVRKVHVRGLAVEQLAVVGGEWARLPLEKLGRSGKGSELLEPIAQALRALKDRSEKADAVR
jgi:HEAT repeat protein